MRQLPLVTVVGALTAAVLPGPAGGANTAALRGKAPQDPLRDLHWYQEHNAWCLSSMTRRLRERSIGEDRASQACTDLAAASCSAYFPDPKARGACRAIYPLLVPTRDNNSPFDPFAALVEVGGWHDAVAAYKSGRSLLGSQPAAEHPAVKRHLGPLPRAVADAVLNTVAFKLIGDLRALSVNQILRWVTHWLAQSKHAPQGSAHRVDWAAEGSVDLTSDIDVSLMNAGSASAAALYEHLWDRLYGRLVPRRTSATFWDANVYAQAFITGETFTSAQDMSRIYGPHRLGQVRAGAFADHHVLALTKAHRFGTPDQVARMAPTAKDAIPRSPHAAAETQAQARGEAMAAEMGQRVRAAEACWGRYLRLLVFAMAELDLLDPAAPGEGANAEHRFRGGTDADLLDVMRARRVLEKAAQAHGSAESWEDGNLRARNWLAARLAKFSEQLPDPSAQDSTAGSQVGERFSDADLQAFRRGDARVVHDVRAREFIVGMGLLAAPEAYVTRGGAYFYVGALQVGLMGSTPNPRRGGETGAFAAHVHLGDLVAALVDNTADVVKEWGHQPADVQVEGRILAAAKYLSRVAEAVVAMDSVEDVQGLGPALTQYGAVAHAVDLGQSGTAPQTTGDTIRPPSGSEAAAKPLWSRLGRDAAWDDAHIVALGPLLRFPERLVAMKKGRVDPTAGGSAGQPHWTHTSQADKLAYLRSEVFPQLDSLRRAALPLHRPEAPVQMPEGAAPPAPASRRSAQPEVNGDSRTAGRRAPAGVVSPPSSPTRGAAEARAPSGEGGLPGGARNNPGPAAGVARTRSEPQRPPRAQEPTRRPQPRVTTPAADESGGVVEEDILLESRSHAVASQNPPPVRRGHDSSARPEMADGPPPVEGEGEGEGAGPWGAARQEHERRERLASNRFLDAVLTGVRKASAQATSRVWDAEECWPSRAHPDLSAAAPHCRTVVDPETCDFAAGAPAGAKVPSWAAVEKQVFGDSSLVESFDAGFRVERAAAETNRRDRELWENVLAPRSMAREGESPPMVLRFEDAAVDGYVQEDVFGDEVEAPDADLAAPARSWSMDDVRVETGAGPRAWSLGAEGDPASGAEAADGSAPRLRRRHKRPRKNTRHRRASYEARAASL